MELSWALRRELVQYLLGGYLVILAFAWIYLRKKGPRLPLPPQYDQFKQAFSEASGKNMLFIPGSWSLLNADQAAVFGHCLKFLKNHQQELAERNLTITVSCPFKYGILMDHIAEFNIRAEVEFLALSDMAFTYANMGVVARQSPAVTFYSGCGSAEVLSVGDTARVNGSFFSAVDSFGSMPDAFIVSDCLMMAEEMYALQACESPELSDQVFLLANDIMRFIFILIILAGSIYLSVYPS